MKKSAIAALFAVSFVPASSHAVTVPAEGFLYQRTVLSQFAEGCVAQGNGGVYVGVAPTQAFPPVAGSRSILFVTEGGAELTVATGLNAISDCYFDRDANLLFVTDNGGNLAGAATGDTVFVFAGDAVADSALGNEVVPAGSIPFAASVTPFGANLLVSNAVGGGNGDLIEIDYTAMPHTMSTFAGGFDYTGGVLEAGSSVLILESHEGAFNNSLHEYDADGNFVATISGPTYSHGSIDVEHVGDGSFAVTGNDTIVRVTSAGVSTPLVTGLDGGLGSPAFGGGVSTKPDGSRIDFLASSFSGADDDKSVHRLVSIEDLVPGRGSASSECAHEFYGVTLVPTSPSKPARMAICDDGDACDADGAVDGGCTFPVGLCLNVPDDRYADCEPNNVSAFELLTVRPASASLTAAAASIQDDAPVADSTCVFSDGVRVLLRGDGTKPGKGVVKVRATTGDSPARKDTDALKLLCRPAL